MVWYSDYLSSPTPGNNKLFPKTRTNDKILFISLIQLQIIFSGYWKMKIVCRYLYLTNISTKEETTL